MACTRPRWLYPPAPGSSDRRWVNSAHKSYSGAQAVPVPCGHCMPCRLNRAMEWSTRLAHEAMFHERSCFLTLTFADQHLPDSYSVDVRDLQLFLKRVRKAGHRVRYFACGEYGEHNHRPHYHLILFGYDFPDKTPWRKTGTGFLCYRSAELERLWPFGHCEVGTVTPQSSGYVARYITKKIQGDMAEEHYTRTNPFTGQVVTVKPEFLVMSTRPAIGHKWFEQYRSDAFPSDFVIIDGMKRPVPRYYYRHLSDEEKMVMRVKRTQENKDNNPGWERERTIEEVQILKVRDRLLRTLE